MSVKPLLDGYHEFMKTRFEAERARFRELAEKGQSPKTLFIACSDSRVDPTIITNAAPGSLFVVRNVANLVPPCEHDHSHHGTSAALEFAVTQLEVENIVVMGHALCGGVRAFVANKTRGLRVNDGSYSFIHPWVDLAQPGSDELLARLSGKTEDDVLREFEHHFVRVSINNLLSFDWVRERVESGKLELHGWHFGIADGHLTGMDPATGEFSQLA